MMIIDNESLWAARRERARRWLQAGTELRGYPALDAADETEKKPKPPGEQVN